MLEVVKYDYITNADINVLAFESENMVNEMV